MALPNSGKKRRWKSTLIEDGRCKSLVDGGNTEEKVRERLMQNNKKWILHPCERKKSKARSRRTVRRFEIMIKKGLRGSPAG